MAPSMRRTLFAKSVARRSMLSAVGAGLAGLLIRPLQAQEAKAAPKRLLIVHRPCGSSDLARFFPALDAAPNAELPPIIRPFAPLRSNMVILNGVNNPYSYQWNVDAHAGGLIGMMSGREPAKIPGTDAGGDPNAKNIVAADATIDQYLLAQLPALVGVKPSIQSTAYIPSISGLPSFKVMSYKGNNQPLFPQADASALFNSYFGGHSPEELASADDDQLVLDCVKEDLARLQDLIPSSQKDKLDSHLAAVQSLKDGLIGGVNAPECKPPVQLALPAPQDGLTIDESQHLALAKNQLAIIRTAFQCDLTRVASFSFAHGNSGLRFQKMVDGVDKGDGHHGISHDTSAVDAQSRIDQVYSEVLSQALQEMQAIPEGSGTLLDNTLVVYLSECAIGITHSSENMPVLMFGGKNLGLQVGKHLQFYGRYMNDVWSAVAGAFGLAPSFGDPAFAKGPVNGLFT